ncbi:unnamed protein product [Rhizophagus irregularis]|nr:unnamed protein product [Rhizophagus irregularis]CAB5374091.1 unnamed protein product [Rhizophagus irregularis]
MSLSKEKKVKILLDDDERHFVILDFKTQRYMIVKIVSAKKHFERGNERNYKSPLKNTYMLFKSDIIDTWNLAQETKNFSKYPKSFKDISLLWNSLPKKVVVIYKKNYANYKELIPKFVEFIPYAPQGENEENMDENIVETGTENIETFVNNSETFETFFRSGEFQHISTANYANLAPSLVQSSELYTLHYPNSENEIEISLLNTENDNMRKFPKYIQYSPQKNVNEGENFEDFIDYSEAMVLQSEEHQHFTSENLPPTIQSVEKNELVSDLDYNDCAPVQSSELYTLHYPNSENEIEISLLNTENDNMREFPKYIQYSPQKNVNEGENFEEFIDYSKAMVLQSEEHQHFTSENLPPTIQSVEKNELVSDLDYNDCAPVQSSEIYTSEMQCNLYDLNSEVELDMYLNALSNTENVNMEEPQHSNNHFDPLSGLSFTNTNS